MRFKEVFVPVVYWRDRPTCFVVCSCAGSDPCTSLPLLSTFAWFLFTLLFCSSTSNPLCLAVLPPPLPAGRFWQQPCASVVLPRLSRRVLPRCNTFPTVPSHLLELLQQQELSTSWKSQGAISFTVPLALLYRVSLVPSLTTLFFHSLVAPLFPSPPLCSNSGVTEALLFSVPPPQPSPALLLLLQPLLPAERLF